MARPRLADAAKNRAKSKVSNKNPAKSSANPTTSASPETSTALANKNNSNSSVSRKDIALPGLPTLVSKDIASHLPKINVDAYKITDPHKLPDTLPQVSDAQVEENKRIAKGAMNAQDSEILALQITSGKFRVMGQQSKTYGEGVKAVTEIEKTTGLMLDLRKQQEVTAQKQNDLDFNIYKTDKEISMSSFEKLTLDEKERLSQIKSRTQKADADSAENELSEKLKKLGLK